MKLSEGEKMEYIQGEAFNESSLKLSHVADLPVADSGKGCAGRSRDSVAEAGRCCFLIRR